MARGFFVTFEGGEGAGKSTQIRRLAQSLRAEGRDVVVTREPGGSPGAEAVRHVLQSGAAEPFGPELEAILFAAARSDHIEQVIRPAVAAGKIVLCDRFMDSSRVYQGVTGNLDVDFMRALERITVADHLPPNAARFLAHDRHWCLEQAGRIGVSCEQLVARLLADRILEKLRAAQGVLRLAEQYTPARLEAACARALAHGSPHYRTVKTILAGGHDLRGDAAAVDLHARHGSAARFARDAADLFTAQPGRLH